MLVRYERHCEFVGGMKGMKQMTLTAGGFERYAKTTRRATILGGDESGCSVGGVVRSVRAGLSESGKRSPKDWPGTDAEHLLGARSSFDVPSDKRIRDFIDRRVLR